MILCKICGSHGGEFEERRPLGYDVEWPFQERTFRRNISPPSSEWKESASKEKR
jgi:hypothetical protein